ncbi:MAG: protease modulator HflC [Planctomycetota bacterium]|jgi:membrane protease subunit HflC
MKNIAITIFIVLLVLVLGAYLVAFQVRETESALVTTFGKPAPHGITEPGLHFKWPAPIQRVHKFDSRMRVFQGDPIETTTKGAVPIIVKTYAVWKIAEPLQFFNAVGTVKEARSKLRSQINDAQNKVVGRHFFGEFVNSDPSKIAFGSIEEEMLADLRDTVRQNYGIEIRTLGIKELKLSEDVSEDVFKRMRSDRNGKTIAIISQGESEATRIRSDADSKKTELLAAAEARAIALRGQGDAEAAKWYEMLDANPELAMFLRNTEALKKTLAEATIVIPADIEPFSYLKEMPNIGLDEADKPKK